MTHTISSALNLMERTWQSDSLFNITEGLGGSNADTVRSLRKIEKPLTEVKTLLVASKIFAGIAAVMMAYASLALAPVSFGASLLLLAPAVGLAYAARDFHQLDTSTGSLVRIMSEFKDAVERNGYDFKGNTTYQQRVRWSAELQLVRDRMRDMLILPSDLIDRELS